VNAPAPPRTLILACGALSRELREIAGLHRLSNVSIECLPAALHNRPSEIPDALRAKLSRVRHLYDNVLIGYADCGTAGEIDAVCSELDAQRLPGEHCYQMYAGVTRFDTMHGADPTAFYLTDFLARHFNRIVLDGLGISSHPELRDLYFGNYTKLIYLAQTESPELERKATAAAKDLGLDYSRVHTGLHELAESVVRIASSRLVKT